MAEVARLHSVIIKTLRCGVVIEFNPLPTAEVDCGLACVGLFCTSCLISKTKQVIDTTRSRVEWLIESLLGYETKALFGVPKRGYMFHGM